jgi:hypothetical protein
MTAKIISPEELALAEVPKFQAVIEAEAQAEQALEACHAIEAAEGKILADAAAAKRRLDELSPVFKERLALQALGRISEPEVDAVRDEMTACRRIIEENPLALPALGRMRRGEGARHQAARKTIEELSFSAKPSSCYCARPTADHRRSRRQRACWRTLPGGWGPMPKRTSSASWKA